MTNFWFKLPSPFFVLAPMEDVTDTVFRQIIAECGAPDVFFTEFTNTDGIISKKGGRIVSQRLEFDPQKERPIVAQIWGIHPESFYTAAKIIAKRGFDGIDINFGCPERSVIKSGACGAMIGNTKLASQIIEATKKGAGNLPVSVKTRIGKERIITEEWIGFLLDQDLDALTVHGRTVAEKSAVPAHWDEIVKAVKVKKDKNSKTLVIGNGDVLSLTDAKQKVEMYSVDGVMIGRGIFSNPWLFEKKQKEHSVEEKMDLLVKHATLYQEKWGRNKNFAVMKKFVKVYANGFPRASNLREKLMKANSADQIKDILRSQKLIK